MVQARLKAAVAAGAVLLATVGIGSPASAQHVVCGQVITENTTLDSNVGPCSANGIIVGADNITLDLNGHSVFGTGQHGDGAGVLVSLRTGVTVQNGTVRLFDAGVVIEGGSSNTVSGITAHDNIGQSGQARYGDGIAILSSTDNVIENNTVRHNGPFSGIGLFERVDSDHPRQVTGETARNIIRGNDIRDNNVCRTPQGSCDDDGIRVEPGVSTTTVVDNYVAGSGLDGIALFRTANSNVVRNNTLEHNGHHRAQHRKGDGVRVFSDFNVVEENKSFHNAGNGVIVGFRNAVNGRTFPGNNNQILRNQTGSNQVLDLQDVSPGGTCGTNTWSGNTFQTAAPPCTTAP